MAAACALVACHAAPLSVTDELVAGNYTYVSMDPESRATDHDLSRLVLRADGMYDLVEGGRREGGTTKPLLEKKGFWRIVPGDPPNILLDHAGYPIEGKRLAKADLTQQMV